MGFVFVIGKNSVPPSKLDVAVMEKFVSIMKEHQNMALVRADYLRSAANIKGYKWRTNDISKLTPYFEVHDVPVEMGIGVLMAENSGHGSKMGITILARSVRAITGESEQDFHASARLLRRGMFWYMIDNPDIYEAIRAKKKYRIEPEEIVFVDPERWINYVVDKIYRPGSNRDSWRGTTLRELKKRRVKK